MGYDHEDGATEVPVEGDQAVSRKEAATNLLPRKLSSMR